MPGALSDKVLDFTGESVVQCDVPVLKYNFLSDGDMQMIAMKI